MLNLEGRWLRLLNRLGIEDTGMLGVLMTMYGEHHRTYHNIWHIKAMLEEFDTVRGLTPNTNAVELAIWFHDAIYDTRRKNNEVKSADVFFDYAKRVFLPPGLIGKVMALILTTKHNEVPATEEAQVLCDLDLSILGQPESMFDEYERQIRQEYDWVPEQEFIKGRLAVLRTFLGRQHIYSTKFFREKYEEQARRNLARSIEQLSSRLQPQ